MIEIHLGNIGSGKTASIVREIVLNKDNKHTFSNIIMKGVKNNTSITPEMIIKKITEEPATPKSKPKEKLILNVDFWKDAVKKYKSINVVLDEAHTIINARRGMSTQNIIMTDFLALLRRIVGSATEKSGKLVLITQLDKRLDVIARDMATRVKFHKCHYLVKCPDCGVEFAESNEEPDKIMYCRECGGSKVFNHNFIIEVFCFANIDDYERFDLYHAKSFYQHYYITDIEKYFKFYDTYQWDNLLSHIT